MAGVRAEPADPSIAAALLHRDESSVKARTHRRSGFFGRDHKSWPLVGNVQKVMEGERRNKAIAPYALLRGLNLKYPIGRKARNGGVTFCTTIHSACRAVRRARYRTLKLIASLAALCERIHLSANWDVVNVDTGPWWEGRC